MKFRTELPFRTSPFTINHQDKILCVGSCFSENIGLRLSKLKFNTKINPYGIIYNPHSIVTCLKNLVEKKQFSSFDLIEHNQLWHSFLHHSRFSHFDKQVMLNAMNENVETISQFLSNVNHIFITLGTAHVFTYKKLGMIVANCHKIPADNFIKSSLSVSEIVDEFIEIIEKIKGINPTVQFHFTVSPVRHTKDGIIENQRSKAKLIVAIEMLCCKYDFVHYFPAYELVMDDLRDYRFYEKDLVHPNEMAIDYIWEYFSNTYFHKETQQLNEQIKAITSASLHRPFLFQSDDYQLFIRKNLLKIDQLLKDYSYLDFDAEIKQFLSNQL